MAPRLPKLPGLGKYKPGAGALNNARSLAAHITTQASNRGEPFVPKGVFGKFLGRLGTNWLTLGKEEQAQVLARFLEVTNATDESVFAPATLSRNLRSHGVEVNEWNPVGQLKALSADNLRRLQRPYRSAPEMKEAEKAIQALRVVLVHNTGVVSAQPTSPLHSSRWLERLGLGGGANTYPWNRDFLETDANVFFLPVISHRQTSVATLAKQNQRYGRNLVVLNNAYARKHGFVSFYQMSANDLLVLSEVMGQKNPAFRAHAEFLRKERWLWGERNPGNTHDTAWGVELEKRFPERLATIRGALSQYDLTVSDFEKLVKTTMLSSLNRMRLSDSGRFSRLLRDIKAPNQDLSSIYETLVLEPLGFPRGHPGFELKVGDMVPAKQVHVYRPDSDPTLLVK